MLVRNLALTLAERIAAGKPLPEEFQRLREVREEDFE